MYFVCFFFVKQKTAYEMRISDWSSDVCSSDLPAPLGQPLYVARFSSLRGAYLGNFVVHHLHQVAIQGLGEFIDHRLHTLAEAIFLGRGDLVDGHRAAIGSASCRERVC